MKILKNILILALVLGFINFAWADTKTETKKQNKSFPLKEKGFLLGFAKGKMVNGRKYSPIILTGRFGYNINFLLEKINLSGPGILEFNIEPFVNPIIRPDNNVELGCGFLLKYALPVTKKIWSYIEAGSGLFYTTQHTPEQSTQFNFLDQIGLGCSYFFNKNFSLSLGWRYRHYSNAKIKQPNEGIGSRAVIVGFSYVY